MLSFAQNAFQISSQKYNDRTENAVWPKITQRGPALRKIVSTNFQNVFVSKVQKKCTIY